MGEASVSEALTIIRQQAQQRCKEEARDGVPRDHHPALAERPPQLCSAEPVSAAPQRLAGPLPIIRGVWAAGCDAERAGITPAWCMEAQCLRAMLTDLHLEACCCVDRYEAMREGILRRNERRQGASPNPRDANPVARVEEGIAVFVVTESESCLRPVGQGSLQAPLPSCDLKHASVAYALAHPLSQGETHLGSCERTFLSRRCSIDIKMTSSNTALAIRADLQRFLCFSIYQLHACRLLV